MTYDTTLATISSPTGTGEGSGILTHLLKALNHATVVLTHDEGCGDVSENAIRDELNEVGSHLRNISATPTWATDETQRDINALRTLGNDIEREAANWTRDQITANLTSFTSRCIGTVAAFDRELFGIETATSGHNL